MRIFALVAGLLAAGCQTTAPNIVDADKWSAPTALGDVLPTPSSPLKDVQGLAGPIPGVERADELTEQFASVVFVSEDQGEDPYVRKWSTPVQFWNYSRHGIGGDIARTTKKLTALTGVVFTKLPRGKRGANLRIITQRGNATDRHCYALGHSDISTREIIAADVFVGPSLERESWAGCVEEELSQIMGPGNDVKLIEDSLWRPVENKTYHSLTWSDAVILRALYDQRLKPGMHKDKAMPIVRTIIGELLTELNQ